MDHGIMAATFVNLESGKAVRIVSTESSRDLAGEYAPDIDDPAKQQLEAYKVMPDDVLFSVEEVIVEVPVHDMPGPSRFKAQCEACGQVVRDKKEVMSGGRILCKPCAYGAYYRPANRKASNSQTQHSR
jgi:formylmethanofuran dehydrogenase subunit E